MKVGFISKYNDGYLGQLKKRKQSFRTYADTIEFLKNDFYYHYGSLAYYLSSNGHQSQIIIPNYEDLQTLWCSENAYKKTSETDIIKAQILAFAPDIVLLNSNFEYYAELIPFLKEKNIKICAWISCPIPENVDLLGIDHIFTLFEPHYQLFLSQNISATLTHGGFDERILDFLTTTKTDLVSFIGGIGGFHRQREIFLRQILKKFPIRIWGYGFLSNSRLKTLIKQTQQKFVFNRAYQGQAWGLEMFEKLHQSKITINYHGDIATGHSVNMRLFEATGAGTLLLTENSKSISKFFEPNKEVLVYNSAEEAIDKINYYLANPEEAKKIAEAGQKRTLKDYNYKYMINNYIKVFDTLLTNEK